ncbi:MAG: hypothetical protein H8E38_00830 [SAR324 cluster bacterium]|nr:hypothetical protein [SAR324 cluster bacterium]MBL7035977.1 hypothetical protein [SAR324 cluster bacterium]
MSAELRLNTCKFIRSNINKLLVVAALFLTGCSLSFPEPDASNQTILIIPVETRQTLGHFAFTLDVTIVDSKSNEVSHHTIEANPKVLFSYNTQLKPGKYKITEMNRQEKPGFKLGGKPRPETTSEIGEFELQKGKITIIDKGFLFQQPDPGKKKKRKDMRNMNDAQKMQERKKQKAENKAERERMKRQKVRFVQVVELEDSFKTKLMEELKEVDNIDLWKLE